MSDNVVHHFVVPSITCQGCVGVITGALSPLSGVQYCQTYLNGHVSITLEKDATTTEKNLIDAIEAVGHTVNTAPHHHYKALSAGSIGLVLFLLNMTHALPSVFTVTGQMIGISCALITLGIIFYSGYQFCRNITAGGMYTLVGLGVLSAWGYSAAQVLTPHTFAPMGLHLYFSAALMVLAIVNIGQWIKYETKNNYHIQHAKTQEDILTKINPQDHWENIQIEDIVTVPAEDIIPVDGTILNKEEVDIDQAMITGNETLYHIKVNGLVKSGSRNRSHHPITIKASGAYKDSYLSTLLEHIRPTGRATEQYRPYPIIDRISQYFAPLVIASAVLSALGWWVFGHSVQHATQVFFAILVCACPCAFALSNIASLIGLSRTQAHNIVMKNEAALHRLSNIKNIVFDKTGTLTTLQFHSIQWLEKGLEGNPNELRPWIAALERQASEQAGSRINREYVNALQTSEEESKSEIRLKEEGVMPQGICGTVDGKPISIGSASFVAAQTKLTIEKQNKENCSAVYVAWENRIAVIWLTNTLRDDASTTINALKGKGYTVHMATGDEEHTAGQVAAACGIDEDNVRAQLLPKDKAAFIKNLGDAAMVGDGFNDIDASAAATASFALAGTAASLNASAIIHTLSDIPKTLEIAEQVHRNVKRSLIWACLYNCFAIALAAGAFYPLMGSLISPTLASVTMLGSSLLIIANLWHLNRSLATAAPTTTDKSEEHARRVPGTTEEPETQALNGAQNRQEKRLSCCCTAPPPCCNAQKML